MKNLKFIAPIFLGVALAAISFNARADETNSVNSAKVTPDNLKSCPVSGDKLGDMGKPYIFTYKGQQVKLCCPDCKEKFEKDPATYMAKIRAADKK